MKNINLLVLDLEMNKPSGTIIQVGCVIGNLVTGVILEEYTAHIKINEKLSEYITKLTGIKQVDIDNGITLAEAYEKIKELHKKYECFRNFLQWGQGDSEYLRKCLNLDDEIFIGGRRTIDAKTIYVSYRFANNLSHQSGLSKSMVKLGLLFNGKKHQACDDARNTFTIYRELLRRLHNA